MDQPDPNTVRDARHSFDLTGAQPADRSIGRSGPPLRAKVFKSGNSLALRLPKALGLEAGMEMEITPTAAGGYSLTRLEPPRRKIDVSGFAGKAPGLKPLPRELREFDERPSTIAARAAASKAAGKA